MADTSRYRSGPARSAFLILFSDSSSSMGSNRHVRSPFWSHRKHPSGRGRRTISRHAGRTSTNLNQTVSGKARVGLDRALARTFTKFTSFQPFRSSNRLSTALRPLGRYRGKLTA
ncbi:hypothetical protein Ddc_22147 [Ditylenchus destructor]|nr:hypothetical protein Ddc_22147 [Ditylenchus destructor]